MRHFKKVQFYEDWDIDVRKAQLRDEAIKRSSRWTALRRDWVKEHPIESELIAFAVIFVPQIIFYTYLSVARR